MEEKTYVSGIFLEESKIHFTFFFSFHYPGGLSAWEGKLDEVEDTDVAEVGECSRNGFVVVFVS